MKEGRIGVVSLRNFSQIIFDVRLTEGHYLQKFCSTPKGFYQQGKNMIFVGDRITNGTIRIKVPANEVVEIKMTYNVEP